MKTRTCIRCKKQKPLQAFGIDEIANRLSHVCMQCVANDVAKRNWQDTWICSNCGEKSISEFHKTPKGGKRYRKCKECIRRDKKRKQDARYRKKHPYIHVKDKVCSRCGVVQSIENFIKNKVGMPAGLCSTCREGAIK